MQSSDHKCDLTAAAAQLKLSYHAAQRLVLTGVIQGARVQGRWFVDSADLARYIRDCDREAAAS